MTSTNDEREALRALERQADTLLRKHGNNLAWQRGPGCDTWDDHGAFMCKRCLPARSVPRGEG